VKKKAAIDAAAKLLRMCVRLKVGSVRAANLTEDSVSEEQNLK